MSAAVRTPQCYPELNTDRLFLGGYIAEPDHEHCPGGQHMPGVIGGWHCPCPCHQKDRRVVNRYDKSEVTVYDRTAYDVVFAAIAQSVRERNGVIEKASAVCRALGIDPDTDLDTHVLVPIPKATGRW